MTRKSKYALDKQPKPFFVKELKPKNYSQEMYLESLQNSIITFGHGAAGTGKTFLAVYVAVTKLLNNEIDKIVLTRPMVATEDIGYLPGNVEEKISPYLMPLFDGLQAFIGPTKMKQLFDDGKIEIAPLAFMRGRSLTNCMVIFDEAENSTKEQMKMFLTRIGYGTTFAINGDQSQSDLDNRNENGLTWAIRKLRARNNSINMVEFSKKDIVRNPLIEEILTHLESPDNELVQQEPVRTRHSFYDEPKQKPVLG